MDNDTIRAQNTCFKLDVWDWAMYCHPCKLVWLQNVLKFCMVTLSHLGLRFLTACFAFLIRFRKRSSLEWFLWLSFELIDNGSNGANEVDANGWEFRIEFRMFWSFTTVVDGCDVLLVLSSRTIDGAFAASCGGIGEVRWWAGLLQKIQTYLYQINLHLQLNYIN